ncbi:MAG: PAS domain S-box protein, partial [Actinobacteria bacterium]|nr:PAS domain S-box protein [Actinomycetota bacterium]
ARPDVSGQAALRQADPVLALGYSAYLGVPLGPHDGPLHGVLAVYSAEPRQWRDEEIEALSALAANASIALANAELYQRVAIEHEQSAAILANIADGIVAVDRDGRAVVWNAAAERITGVPSTEALGRMPAQVLQRELESETGVSNRLISIMRGGEEIWLSLSEALMRDPSGAVAGRIFAFRDISSERAVEQMKSDFVSTVSHELRTPLTSIYGFAETLLRDDVQFGERERNVFLTYIATESSRLTKIVDTLLNVARLDTGDLKVELEPTDIGALVASALQAREGGASNGHSFVVDLGDGDGLEVQADPEKLRQVVDELVENAVKYSPDGGVVRVEAHRRPDAVEVSVVDEGIGIPQAHRDRIFEKFYKVGDTVTGTGLGLFIARGLVSAMGGRIRVESNEGRGSRFTFELPVAGEE